MFTYYTNTNIIPTRFVHHSEPNGIRKNWRVELLKQRIPWTHPAQWSTVTDLYKVHYFCISK